MMTHKYLVNFFGFAAVTVFVVSGEECQWNSNENCSSTVQNNEIEKLRSTQETPKPVIRPKSLNMLADDSDPSFKPTTRPFSSTSLTGNFSRENISNSLEEPKGRALNFSADDHNIANVLSNSSNNRDMFDLSDVTINDDDDDDIDMLNSKILSPKTKSKNSTLGVCEKGGLTYENGEKLENGCDSICTCKNGKMDCVDRCRKPFFRTGKKIDDPLCTAKEAADQCCSVLVCAGDTETEPLEICSYQNETYNRGDIFNKECSEVCTCEVAGRIACKPRCPPTNKSNERCVELPDPNDSCCKRVLCDVTLHDNEPEREDEKSKRRVLSAKFLNSTTILLKFDSKFDDNESSAMVEISDDKTDWQKYKIHPGGYIFVKTYSKYLKLENSDEIINIQNFEGNPKLVEKIKDNSNDCLYKGKLFKIGDEYNDECAALCVCQEGGMKCLKIQCPTYFGVDVLDPNCVEWETVPPNFKPSPPKCCPDSVHCKNNGSCEYEGEQFKNWEQLPTNITGCEKRCYCEMGKVECQNVCSPVTALPPATLPCPPNLAVISNVPDDDCCKHWICHSPNNTSAVVNKETDSDNEGHTTQNPTNTYFGPLAPKIPSKILGPLAVYGNEDSNEYFGNDTLGSIRKPAITPQENPFYHKSTSPFKPDKKATVSKDKINDYVGPISPNYALGNQYNKDSLFVTPPSEKPFANENENSITHNSKHSTPASKPPQKPNRSEVEIHGDGNTEELLQFINQHPEISNYPSGSVLEIHNFPAAPKQPPDLTPFFNQPLPAGKPQIHLVPYLVPQNSGDHTPNDLPPGFTLEQILQEFHKNTQPHPNSHLPFPPQAQYPDNNGAALVAQHSGPILPNRQNTTYSDIGGQQFPGRFPGFSQPQDDILVHTLEAIDPHTVRLGFMIPRVIVGLHGRVEVRYTHKDDDDLDSWMLQVFAPPNDLITTPSLEFDLLDLKANTEYRIKITITLRDVHTTPTSRIYKIKTPRDIQLTTLPPMIPIEPDLAITDINATWVTVIWRKFTKYELQFIDGVQLRFKEIEGKIYAATPLIHRAVTSYTLENLKPNTKYEIGIFFIPFPNQLTELHAENMLHFTTANEIDTYGFNVTLEISQVKSQTVEISWNGVPYPEDKYVNIYRAIYQSDSGKEDQSTFKIAKRDSPTKTIIMDLKPGTRYRLWLEVYLTNGKIKTSNVQDFITKPRVAPALGSSTQQDKLARAEQLESKGDYYGPLVIVAILAAIAILSTLVLLLILVRRHNQNKAAITPPSTRVSQSAYDNPTYKVEIQQETMGL